MPQPTLTSSRLRLSPITVMGLDRFIDLLAEPGVRRYLCDDEVLPRERVAALIEQGLASGSSGLGLWGLETERTWVGCAGLMPVSGIASTACPDFVNDVEPVIALHEAAWGNGYARETLEALLAYAFRTLGLARVVAFVDEPNTQSHALMLRTGFTNVAAVQGPRYLLRVYERRSP